MLNACPTFKTASCSALSQLWSEPDADRTPVHPETDRNSVQPNELFARYYQAHFNKALRLRGLDVLEQFYT